MIKHIIFDCDGVLIDTEIVAAEVMSAWLRDNDMPISAEQFIAQHTGKTFSGIIRELQASKALSMDVDLVLGVREIEERVKANIRLVDGVKAGLSQIETPLSVVSNSTADYVQHALFKFGIDNHFGDRIFSSEMVAKPKPSPLVYELAVERIGIHKQEILVIEDSATGVQAARSAGLNVVGLLAGSHILADHDQRLLTAGALTTVDSYSELLDYLGKSVAL